MNETIVMSGYGIVGEPLSKKSTVHRKSVQGVRTEATCPSEFMG